LEQRISLFTLGVADLPRAVAFYERVLGWKAESSPPRGGLFRSERSCVRPLAARRAGEGHGVDARSCPGLSRLRPRSQCSKRSGSPRDFCSAEKPWRNHSKATAKSLLGRILRIFFRSGWPYVGDRLQSVLDHRRGRPRVDEEGLRKSAPFTAWGSGKIVKIVVSYPADPADSEMIGA